MLTFYGRAQTMRAEDAAGSQPPAPGMGAVQSPAIHLVLELPEIYRGRTVFAVCMIVNSMLFACFSCVLTVCVLRCFKFAGFDVDQATHVTAACRVTRIPVSQKM